MTSTNVPSDSPLSEADIQAYADGTLTPERAAFLQDYLGKDPAEARRVAFYGRLNAQMQKAFETTDEPSSSRSERWRGTLDRLKAARRPGKAVKALAALVLTLVAASGWLAATQASRQALNNAAVMALAETAAAPYSAASPTRTNDSPHPTSPRSDCDSWIKGFYRSAHSNAPPNSCI